MTIKHNRIIPKGTMHKIRENSIEAIRLFQEMQAPKQLEKLQKAMGYF
ncbi:MAG: hypothetical protein NHB32_14075 [Fischerella sp. CENA71]|nr:hypothetical protein [Fischerella sp. CENA71]